MCVAVSHTHTHSQVGHYLRVVFGQVPGVGSMTEPEAALSVLKRGRGELNMGRSNMVMYGRLHL